MVARDARIRDTRHRSPRTLRCPWPYSGLDRLRCFAAVDGCAVPARVGAVLGSPIPQSTRVYLRRVAGMLWREG